MLATLLALSLVSVAPQQPVAALAAAVAVRGDAELDPATAFASARRKAETHVRDRWRERAHRTFEQRPFWLPEFLSREAERRWVNNLPVQEMVQLVDREDRERVHEFGNSYQTTLWVAEDDRHVQRRERELRGELRRLERATALKLGGITATWTVLALLLVWLDRLSRGYMTGRLCVIGLLAGGAVPLALTLV